MLEVDRISPRTTMLSLCSTGPKVAVHFCRLKIRTRPAEANHEQERSVLRQDSFAAGKQVNTLVLRCVSTRPQ